MYLIANVEYQQTDVFILCLFIFYAFAIFPSGELLTENQTEELKAFLSRFESSKLPNPELSVAVAAYQGRVFIKIMIVHQDCACTSR